MSFKWTIKGLENLNNSTSKVLLQKGFLTIDDIFEFDNCELKTNDSGWDKISGIGTRHIMHINEALIEKGYPILKRVSISTNKKIDRFKNEVDKVEKAYQQGRADSEIIRKVFSKMEQPNNCLFNNMSACCYPISDCMNCPITIEEMKS